MPAVLSQSQKLMAHAALILSVLAIFVAVAMQATPCAHAAAGSCSVGDLETFTSAITVNTDLNDADTIISGDTVTNLWYVDAGNDRIGINTDIPGGLFDVSGALTATTIDGTIGSITPAAATFTTLNATGGGALTGTWTDLGSVTTIDINGGTINGITDLAVADGGTGVSSLTDHGVMIGSGTGGVSVTAVGTTGQVLTGVTGADPVWGAAGQGVTEADLWRLTTSFTGDATPIASNLERSDSLSFGLLGTGMTESSGIFSFPSTGIWLVEAGATWSTVTAADDRLLLQIRSTTDDSTYAVAASAYTAIYTGGAARAAAFTQIQFDVTDISNDKVRFDITDMAGSNETLGSTSQNFTYMRFTRLAGT